MTREFNVRHKGHRYWANFQRMPTGKIGLVFWSNHKGLFYHAHYTPDVLEADDCWEKFMEFIPQRRTSDGNTSTNY